ncbi:hypothetical protein MI149_30305 (plasmid) [Mycolicibacterium crocinum]|uniref:Uncharacterized protein n=1 Tax=Mycolicibacterium crocinum TaxID=388459 RepID=A0ABY5TT35_9MYCO|nr:hypothetical protein [Mycolicibacterium crocinum]UVY96054.1 hypothetical protein MI149_30305 [Mycolicibacterium crocinum]
MIAASAAKREKIIEDVARSAGPHDDIDYLTDYRNRWTTRS